MDLSSRRSTVVDLRARGAVAPTGVPGRLSSLPRGRRVDARRTRGVPIVPRGVQLDQHPRLHAPPPNPRQHRSAGARPFTAWRSDAPTPNARQTRSPAARTLHGHGLAAPRAPIRPQIRRGAFARGPGWLSGENEGGEQRQRQPSPQTRRSRPERRSLVGAGSRPVSGREPPGRRAGKQRDQ